MESLNSLDETIKLKSVYILFNTINENNIEAIV